MGTEKNIDDTCNKKIKNCLCHLPMELLHAIHIESSLYSTFKRGVG